MKERRKQERRQWKPPPKFPFIDSNGVLVTHNRRRTLDRRSGSTQQIEADTQQRQEQKRILLRFNDHTAELSEGTNQIVAGRGISCDIVVKNKYTSRSHARFECRNGALVIVDESANGTYVTTEEGEEIHLKGNAVNLSGSGMISLGSPVHGDDLEIIHFSCG